MIWVFVFFSNQTAFVVEKKQHQRQHGDDERAEYCVYFLHENKFILQSEHWHEGEEDKISAIGETFLIHCAGCLRLNFFSAI